MNKKILFLSIALIIGASFFIGVSFVLADDATSSQPFITLLSPNGGESFVKGATTTVSWYSSVPPSVPKIEVLKGTSIVMTDSSLWAVLNLGNNNWGYPLVLSETLLDGSDYKVRVSQYNISTGWLSDESDRTFIIGFIPPCTDSDGGKNPDVAGLTDGRVNGLGSYFNDTSVASNGGQCSGDSCTSVAEGYCTTDGQVLNILMPCSTGYSVNGACATKPAQPTVNLKVNNSDNPSPLEFGSGFTASWSSIGTTRCDGYGQAFDGTDGVAWTDARLSASGSKALYAKSTAYPFSAPLSAVIGIQCWIEGTNTSITDELTFIVNRATSTQPSITVLSPNGGESWQAGSTWIIKWQTSEVPVTNGMTVRLRSIATGQELLTTSNNENNGYVLIPIPIDFASGLYKAEVKTSVNGVSYMDASDSYFTITAATSSLSCTDSDGGVDYYMKGFVKDQYSTQFPNGQIPDTCEIQNIGSNSTFVTACSGNDCYVRDYYCLGADNHSSAALRCPNGCSNGACVAATSTQPSPFGVYINFDKKQYVPGDMVKVKFSRISGWTQEPYTIDIYAYKSSDTSNQKLISGFSIKQPSTFTINLKDYPVFQNGDGQYIILVCAQGADCSLGSSTNTNRNSGSFVIATSLNQPALSASLVDASADVTNGGFVSPGAGVFNKNGNDWHWRAGISSAEARKIKSAYILHNTQGEGWSTTDSASMLGKVLYALSVHRNGARLNSSYNEPIAISAGKTTLDLYGQPESAQFTGGKLVVEFTDGANVSAKIMMASNIQQSASTTAAALTSAKEQVKCVFKFKGAASEQKCYTATDSASPYHNSGCSGSETCAVDLKGINGDKITWKSSCGGYAYTVMDGVSEYAIFYCADSSATPTPTVQSLNDQISDINEKTKLLSYGGFEFILAELNELRSLVKEQQTEIKYLKSLLKDVQTLSENMRQAINKFITYGVDLNTEKLGAGERAAVINSYKAAFDKLPESEAELADAIKIANGRFPLITSDEAEREAKEQFIKIYKRRADLNNPNDNAAIKVMAYGLRQKAENRNLRSEQAGIRIFKNIFGRLPRTTEDWNTMQAITYSGASR